MFDAADKAILDELLQYANYRVQISVSKMK